MLSVGTPSGSSPLYRFYDPLFVHFTFTGPAGVTLEVELHSGNLSALIATVVSSDSGENEFPISWTAHDLDQLLLSNLSIAALSPWTSMANQFGWSLQVSDPQQSAHIFNQSSAFSIFGRPHFPSSWWKALIKIFQHLILFV